MLVYTETDTASVDSGIAASLGLNPSLVSTSKQAKIGGTPGSAMSCDIQGTSSGGLPDQIGTIWESPSNDPGVAFWPGGSWTVHLNVTSGSGRTLNSMRIARILSGGGGSIIAASTGLGISIVNGDNAISITSSSSSGNATDKWCVLLGYAPSVNNSTVGYTGNLTVSTPLTAPVSMYAPVTIGPPIPGAPWLREPLYPYAPPPPVVMSVKQQVAAPVQTGPPIPGAPWTSPMEGVKPYPGATVAAPAVKPKVKPFVTRVPDPKDVRRSARITEVLSGVHNSLVAQGQLVQTGSVSWSMRPAAIVMNRNPGLSDDVSQGYSVGNIWVNSATQGLYICVSNAFNAAVWKGPI